MIYKLNRDSANFEEVLQKISELEEKIFARTSYSYQGLLDMLKHSEAFQCFYIETEGQLLAYLLVLNSGDCFEILKIAVREDFQRQGLGCKLMQKIATKDIFLEVRETNQKAKTFYQKYGFQEIARRKEYYPDTREDAVIMKMEVNYES